jgi:hypothetical protein
MGNQLTITDDSTTIDLHSTGGVRSTGTIDDCQGSVPGLIGRVLRDRYVLVDQLGSGGKGSVFKARSSRRPTVRGDQDPAYRDR